MTGLLLIIYITPPVHTNKQDEFTAMREQYMRGGEGFLLIYSVTDKRSFAEVRKFKEMIDRVRNYESVPIVIVGNKSDLEANRQISRAEGEAMSKEFGCPFFESSAALRYNVDEVYHDIVRCIRKKENADYIAENPTSKRSSSSKSSGRSSLLCCFSGEPWFTTLYNYSFCVVFVSVFCSLIAMMSPLWF